MHSTGPSEEATRGHKPDTSVGDGSSPDDSDRAALARSQSQTHARRRISLIRVHETNAHCTAAC